MNVFGENDVSWLDSLVAKVIANLEDFNDATYELLTPDDSFFVSSMFFVKITANSNEKDASKTKTLSLVVKRPTPLAAARDIMHIDAQFHNEILFYRRYAMGSKDFSSLIYADENPPTESVMVFENVTKKGYSLCKTVHNVPLEYTMAAIREIARFHGKGYVMKHRKKEEFFSIVGDIWETRYFNDPSDEFEMMINRTSSRAIEYLRKNGYDKDFCDKMKPFLDNLTENYINKCVEPEEPLSTLCHGDFTLNNTFFKKENGELKAMLIDFALMRYGSPVIDLSTYLCLHCAEDLDKDLIVNVLKMYHDSLVQYLTENDIQDHVISETYSYEAIREEFRKRSLLGYTIASFFLAMTMGKSTFTPEEIGQMESHERLDVLYELGGDEISGILARMLLNLKEFGVLDDIV
ncbi:uncharacterized protein LOC128875563 [Hylaeus volcanicus]|uniref:uncharacterized protein LOC128875563 n=1 Tax=Hylaeus volcanicus TaxID=313075 RepID=UPI0023B7B5FF|nr:uncharacterized protein LOC128875563 [Hylaeus volcanicus]XP_053977209.1 uncharacterized protein LOC128875563 [Hylaeus volcanicus]